MSHQSIEKIDGLTATPKSPQKADPYPRGPFVQSVLHRAPNNAPHRAPISTPFGHILGMSPLEIT